MGQRLVKWNKRGLKKLKEILDYFNVNSEKAADNFNTLIQIKIKVLQKYPESGLVSKKKKGVRSVKIDKRRRMYYRFTDKELIIFILLGLKTTSG